MKGSIPDFSVAEFVAADVLPGLNEEINMSKYFSGISFNEGKYTISIINDNLNIIFMDTLEFNELCELLKRKTITTISIDAPIMLYMKNRNTGKNEGMDNLKLEKRDFDNILSSRNMFTYQERFNIDKEYVSSIIKLYDQLCNMGFSYKNSPSDDKSIIESYPDTSVIAMGWNIGKDISQNDTLRKKVEILKKRNIRIKRYLKKSVKDSMAEINTLIQAYTSHLYHANGCKVLGSLDEGILALPGIEGLNRKESGYRIVQKYKSFSSSLSGKSSPSEGRDSKETDFADKKPSASAAPSRAKNDRVMTEYCGAQYLYDNIDGSIRINDLRPIKSYGPFTEIYELNSIKRVQVFMYTIDGLRKVKANFIPYSENHNIFKAADDEDKRKLDNFWGSNKDKHGYLIKFNKVEVIKA
jgi:hypothetical protein